MNYIVRHWRGENSLAYAYWVNAVLLQIAIGAGVAFLANTTTAFSAPPRALACLALIAAVTLWSLVGVWRSAGNSIEAAQRAAPRRTAVWAYIARVMVVIGFLQSIVTLVPQVNDVLEARKLQNSPLATEFSLFTRGETDVVLEGYINEPGVRAVKQAFNASKKRNALVIRSPGGLLAAAFELADFVEARRIIVATDGQCHSACLLPLAASHMSFVTANADLALHDPDAAADFVSSDARLVLERERREFYDRMLRYGVPDQELSALKRDKWVDLSLARAWLLGLADYLWDPLRNEVAPLGRVCARVDCSEKPLVLADGLTPFL
jgi:ATP-dependent protease ClpP protease subunit